MKKLYVLARALVAVALVASFTGVTGTHAAVNVTSTTTSGAALAGALVGGGITIVGAPAYVGGQNSSGFFTGGVPPIGINSGIILSTGNAFDAEPPNNSDSSSALSSGQADADLNGLVGGGTTDRTVLEFDFQFTGGGGGDLFFNYVFASEEYNEYAGTTFNDVFAFFLDGVNIALIPSTTTPVSINTVNSFTNSSFYNNNDLNDGGAFLNQIGYDGFTDVFQATKTGLASGTHHIKLAISDRTDTAWDSAVFIQAGSFSDVPTDPLVPEPASMIVWGLLGLVAAGTGYARRRRSLAG